MAKPRGEPGDIRGTSGKVRNRLGFVAGAAARAGWRGIFRDGGMCWIRLGPGFVSTESAADDGRAGGPVVVSEFPVAGSRFPRALGLSS